MSASPAPNQNAMSPASHGPMSYPIIPTSLTFDPSTNMLRPRTNGTDIASLRSAALNSAKRQKMSMPDHLLNKEEYASSSVSHTNTLLVPLANVDISDDAGNKEEGEISEDEDTMFAAEEVMYDEPIEDQARKSRYSPPRHSTRFTRRSPSSDFRPRPLSQVSSASSSTPTMRRLDNLKANPKGKGREVSPGPVASAPTDISPHEARQYMDIIRNLLQDGFSPDALIRRGATAKYVTAVCEEIVEETKRRQMMSSMARESARANSDGPARSPSVKFEQSPSPDIEISINRERSPTLSSEGLAENMLVQPTSPPQRAALRLVPSSSWTPSSGSSSSKPVPASAVKIDDFPPAREASADSVQTPSATILPPRGSPRPAAQPVSQTLHAGSPYPGPLARLAPIPAPSSPRHAHRRHTSEQQNSSGVDYDVSATTSAAKLPKEPMRFATISGVLNQVPSIGDSQGSLGPVALHTEIATKNALLDTRRKVLESMRARRAALDLKSVDSNSAVQVTITAPTPIAEKSIEDEVADLEQEVLGLQATSDAQPSMKPIESDDESEEGEISSSTPSPPVVTLVSLPSTSSAPPPTRPPRGIKRPNAEDLDGRPVTAPSRSLVPRRRPFGPLQRPHRLLISLDDSESESDEEEGPSTGDAERQRLMEEKEKEIRRLKDLIAAKMKARQPSTPATPATPASVPMSPAPSEEVTLHAVQDPVEAAPLTSSTSLPAGQDQPVDLDMGPGNEMAAKSQESADSEFIASIELNDVRNWFVLSVSETVTLIIIAEQASTLAIEPVAEADGLPVAALEFPVSSSANFREYQPLLSRYPQLANSSVMTSALPNVPLSPVQDPLVATLKTINQSLLSYISLTNRLRRDPNAAMCRSEASGGKCADPTCGDLHLEKGLHPTYEDVGEYIAQVLSAPVPSKTTINAAIVAAKIHLTQDKDKDKGKGKSRKPSPSDVISTTSDELVTLMRQVGLLLRQ
ncbi:hypothetical protein BCR39DRAFT_517651 [Naematelia encephala]|uniref:Putative zinc-finger domain-containing protein n=1 Tax=Naematelia encephala TaxID=71784 RepID=A0A1Y2BHQ2_9TREE|nr:hypothetical protein BCR39DRAFT_517651 [Naematelia encephala]